MANLSFYAQEIDDILGRADKATAATALTSADTLTGLTDGLYTATAEAASAISDSPVSVAFTLRVLADMYILILADGSDTYTGAPGSWHKSSSNDYTTAEKEKLAGIEAQANKTVVDNALSDSSENPVQNKVVQAPLARLIDAGAKNLLKNDAVSQSTVVVNPDGTMTINGTNSGTVNLEISVFTVLPPGDYVLSSDDIVSNVYLTVRIANGGAQYTCTGQTKSVSFHLDDETQIERIYLFINRGTVISNLTVKPMICTKAAWDISQEFVPYRPSYDELVARIEALESGGN